MKQDRHDEFIARISKLEAVEFLGLMQIMGTLPKVDKDAKWEDLEVDDIVRPVVERFDSLSAEKQKEILKILKTVEKQNKKKRKK